MNDPAEESHRGRIHPRNEHQLDKSVLKYLRDMITYCRRRNDRETRWYYEQAWEFAAAMVYGPLPARPQFNIKGLNLPADSPEQVATPWLPGSIRMARREMPLRTIVKRFTRNYNNFDYQYETLECYHILLAPVGYSVPAKSRRCPHCAVAAMVAKKKPARADAAKAKAVGA